MGDKKKKIGETDIEGGVQEGLAGEVIFQPRAGKRIKSQEMDSNFILKLKMNYLNTVTNNSNSTKSTGVGEGWGGGGGVGGWGKYSNPLGTGLLVPLPQRQSY